MAVIGRSLLPVALTTISELKPETSIVATPSVEVVVVGGVLTVKVVESKVGGSNMML